jgi:hypothetical protein
MSNLSYLLIADDKINLSLDPTKRDSLKAHIKFSLLFEEKVLLTDAHIIGNRNLRDLLASDNGFVELFDKNSLTIALRDYVDFTPVKNGVPFDKIENPSLSEILDGFISWNKNTWGKSEIAMNRYSQKAEISEIEKRANVKRYNYFDINHAYTEDILELYNSGSVRKLLGDKVSDLIVKLASEKRDSFISDINPKGGIGTWYFKTELRKDFKSFGLEKKWRSLREKIIQIAEAPYLTALPKVIDANPIYGNMHRKPIELLKGSKLNSMPVGEVKNYKTRLLRFEEGINRLMPDSIFRLRDSDEFRVFRNKLTLFNDSDSTVLDVLIALENYKNKIDDEILFSFPDLKEHKKINREVLKVLNIINESSTYGGLVLGGMAVATLSFKGSDEIGLGLGLLNLYLTRLLLSRIKKDVNETEILKIKLNNVLTEDETKSIIKSESILNRFNSPFNIETFYDSVV